MSALKLFKPLIRHPTLVIALFGTAVFAVYALSPIIESGDSRLVIYEADSIVQQGNLDLREHGPIIHNFPCVRQGEHQRLLTIYPWGTAVVAVPFVSVAHVAGSAIGADPVGDITVAHPRDLEKLIASAIAALAAVSLLLLGRELTGRLAPGLALGIAFALGTSLWSTASRGLWQHGPTVLFTTLALFCLVRGRKEKDWRWTSLSGIPLGISFAVRPSVAVTIVLVAGMLLLSDRRALAGFVAATSAIVVPTIIANLTLYGTVIVPIYLPGRGPLQSGLSDTIGEGLAGTMISPGRGLLVFSPFLLLAVAGLWLKRRRIDGLDVVAAVSLLAIWFSYANSSTWEAGASFGPRYLTDTLPFWAYLAAPAFALIVRPVRSWTPAIGALAAFAVLTFAGSAVIHGRGAISWAPSHWNGHPTPAYDPNDRSRLWDWHDLQFFATGQVTFSDIYPDHGLPAITPDQFCVYPK